MATLWLTGYPFIQSNTTGTSITGSGAINQSGFLSAVIVPAASGAPTAAQVYAGQNSAGTLLAAGFRSSGIAAASGTIVAFAGSSLASETSYELYAVASGYVDNAYSAVSGIIFTTPDITAPLWTATYPKQTLIGGTSGVFSLALNEANCSGWVYVTVAAAATPSAADIKASGTGVAMATANTPYSITRGSLISETAYKAHFVGQDASANLQSSGIGIVFTTTDITAPVWATGYPNITVLNTIATVSMKQDSDGSGFFVIVPRSDAAPSSTQIIAGTDAYNNVVRYLLYGSTALTANTETQLSVMNLVYANDYTIYSVGEDTSGNKSTVVSTNFSTLRGGIRRKEDKKLKTNSYRAMFN